MGSFINKIEYYLPSKILDNRQLEAEFPEWNGDKIQEKVGINQRHIADENETSLDLAFEASKKVLVGFDKTSVDFILLCTQSPDYFLPTTACILQDKLGLKVSIGALDYNLGCSGYIYGLALAKSLINSNLANQILLVTAETYSKYIHLSDKANRSIFGDGAAASIITKSADEKILDFKFGTDGSGMNNLIVMNGGMRNKIDSDSNDITDDSGFVRNDNYLYMNGPEIFNFTIKNVPDLISAVLHKNNFVLEDIDYVIFHQANKFMLDYLRKKLKIPAEKFYMNIINTGNTVSATIPIALKDCLDNSIIKKGDKVLLAGFGVGYSWGATVIEV